MCVRRVATIALRGDSDCNLMQACVPFHKNDDEAVDVGTRRALREEPLEASDVHNLYGTQE